MSPTPPGKPAGVVRRLRRQLDRVMPDGLDKMSLADPEDSALAVAIEIDTDGFPVYDVSPRGPRAQKGPFTEISK
ncbi:hypothetical protein ACWC09_36960 [Streptomyces sp. NPDC001617]